MSKSGPRRRKRVCAAMTMSRVERTSARPAEAARRTHCGPGDAGQSPSSRELGAFHGTRLTPRLPGRHLSRAIPDASEPPPRHRRNRARDCARAGEHTLAGLAAEIGGQDALRETGAQRDLAGEARWTGACSAGGVGGMTDLKREAANPMVKLPPNNPGARRRTMPLQPDILRA
jgi:hypothetical protein